MYIYTLISLKEKWNMDTNIAPFTVPFTTLQSDQKKYFVGYISHYLSKIPPIIDI